MSGLFGYWDFALVGAQDMRREVVIGCIVHK
jgi:hypothetical protein